VVERDHRVRGGENRQGRGKRRRRTAAGVEARDEAEPENRGESHGRKAEPGSGFPGLGAPQGRRTSREEVPGRRTVLAPAGRQGRRRSRGPRERAQGHERYHDWKGNQPASRLVEDAKVHVERRQGRRRSREAERTATPGGQTLKANATPREGRTVQHAGQPAGERKTTGKALRQRTGNAPRPAQPATADSDTPKG
jgi:hypothetical protein